MTWKQCEQLWSGLWCFCCLRFCAYYFLCSGTCWKFESPDFICKKNERSILSGLKSTADLMRKYLHQHYAGLWGLSLCHIDNTINKCFWGDKNAQVCNAQNCTSQNSIGSRQKINLGFIPCEQCKLLRAALKGMIKSTSGWIKLCLSGNMFQHAPVCTSHSYK